MFGSLIGEPFPLPSLITRYWALHLGNATNLGILFDTTKCFFAFFIGILIGNQQIISHSHLFSYFIDKHISRSHGVKSNGQTNRTQTNNGQSF